MLVGRNYGKVGFMTTIKKIVDGVEVVENTMINIMKNTRDRIRTIGKMSQSYDDVINMICDFWDVNHPSWDREFIESNMRLLSVKETENFILDLKSKKSVILEIENKYIIIRERK